MKENKWYKFKQAYKNNLLPKPFLLLFPYQT